MNIDDLTYGEIKQIAQMFAGANKPNQHTAHSLVGKVVLARCYTAGVHCGEVVSVDGENVMLKNSIRLWSWKAKDGIALSGVAQNGITDGCKLDTVNPLLYLTGVCELIPMSHSAQESIYGK